MREGEGYAIADGGGGRFEGERGGWCVCHSQERRRLVGLWRSPCAACTAGGGARGGVRGGKGIECRGRERDDNV